MVSDAEILRQLTAVLRQADFSTTTTTAIRQRLQIDLGVDLSEKKVFIRQHVDLYLLKQSQEQQLVERGGKEGADGGIREERGVREQEDDECRVGGEEELDEDESRKAVKIRVEPESKRMRAKIDRAIRDSLTMDKKKKTGSRGGLTKTCALSPELQVIIGESELPRTQVVKQLWIYIREHSLQDPLDKRKIICDDALRNLLGTKCTDMFKMNKLLAKHIWPIDDVDTVAARDGDKDIDLEDAQSKPKKRRIDRGVVGTSTNVGFLAPCPVSEQLSSFLGADDGKVSRADAVKHMWDYIKENNLQDPSNKKMILCDEQLQDLFDCGQFVGFDLTKLLARHFVKSDPL